MKCPFGLQLQVYKATFDETSFCVREVGGQLITGGFPEAKADYIVNVINSYEKLVEALKKYGDHKPGCIKGSACNCGFEQALKGE